MKLISKRLDVKWSLIFIERMLLSQEIKNRLVTKVFTGHFENTHRAIPNDCLRLKKERILHLFPLQGISKSLLHSLSIQVLAFWATVQT